MVHTLGSLLAEGVLVLYFYPADFTPGCTAQACSLRDVYHDLGTLGVRVVGVSAQSSASHTRFRERHALPFTLLSDPGKDVIRAYGALSFGVLPRRVTYLIGPDRRIVDRVVADISIGRHAVLLGHAATLARRG